MKKSLFLMLVVSLVFLSACATGKTQTLEEFYKDAKIEQVDQVTIQDGTTGASKTITNPEQIDEFLNLINEIEFNPQKNQEERLGWLYRITLFDGEQEFQFTLNQNNDTYYDSNPDIHPIVDDYYKNLTE